MHERTQIGALTGLRGVAALWVLAFHAFACRGYFGPLDLLDSAGYLGVDVFFILSGFVLSFNYSRVAVSYGVFLRKRLARIYPAYAFVLLVMLLAVAAATNSGLPLPDSMFTTRGFVESLLLVQAWHGTLRFVWNGPSWSVSAEWAAYLLFPVIAWVAVRLKSPRHLLLGLALCFAALYVAPLVADSYYSIVNQAARLFGEFTAGVLAEQLFSLRGPQARAGIWSDLCLIGLLFGSNLMDSLTWIGASNGRMEAVACAAVYFLAAGRGVLGKVLASPTMLYLGRISYAVYLVHFSWLMASDLLAVHHWQARWAIRVAAVAASVLSAHGLHRYVEEPARRWLINGLSARASRRPQVAAVGSPASPVS